jgi:signal transduction histidine kinase/ligand-binding sensor domain-containing protein
VFKLVLIKPVLLVLSLFCFKLSFGQKEQYKQLSVKNGLPSNTIYKAFQDSRGFIWFASDAGVARYDGINFEKFTMDDGLSDNEVLDIKEDSKGRIWFLTFNGQLSYMDNEKIYNQENDSLIKNFKQNGFVCSMFEDKDHNLWFGRSSKLVTELTPKGLLIDFELPFTGRGKTTHPYFFEYNGLYCMSGCGIFKVEKNRITIFEKFGNEQLAGFVPYSQSANKIVYPTPNGVYSFFKGKKQCLINDSSQLNFMRISNFTLSKNDDIWITTNTGQTSFYKKKGNSYEFINRYLDSLQVIHVFIDKEENIWFCTRSNGVFFKVGSNIVVSSFKQQNGLNADEVLSMHLDDFNAIWLGFANGKVQRYRDNKFVTYDCNFFARSSNRILKIVSDSIGNILLATDEGISIIKRNSQSYSKPKFIRLQNNQDDGRPYYAKDISISSNNKIYFNSAVCKGFLRPSNQNYLAEVDNSTLDRLRLFTSYIDKQNTRWISAVIGLVSVKNNIVVNYALQDPWLKQRFTKIIELSDGNLVLCTAGRGLAIFNKKKVLSIITVKNKLGSNTINDIFVKDDNLFIATNKGVSCFKYQQGKLIFKFNYDINEGLLSNKVNAIMIIDTLLYAATSEGLSIVKFKNYQFKQPHLQTHIKFFKVNGENQLNKEKINVDYKKSHFQVHFITPVFTHTELLSYQYQLKGKSETWVSTNNDFVEFYGLSPGKYTFKVRALYNNNIDQNPAEITFNITPPFWQTTWFTLLIIIIATAAVFIAVRYLAKIKFEKQLVLYETERKLSSERTRIADEMHDDVGADLSNLLLKIRMDELKYESKGVIDLIGMRLATSNIIKKLDEIIWSLNAQKDTLEGLVNFITKYYQDILNSNNLKGSLKIPSQIPSLNIGAELKRDIFLSTKEALNNSLKHAKAKELNLNITVTDKEIIIIVKDNGVGFSTNKNYVGNGLKNLEKRTSKSKGNMIINSSKNEGTEILLSFPFI